MKIKQNIKLIPIITSLSLILSAIPLKASDNFENTNFTEITNMDSSEQENPYEIFVYFDYDDGMYKSSSEFDSNAIRLVSSGDDGVYILDEKTYLSEIDTGIYQIFTKFEFRLMDESYINEILLNPLVSQETKDSLLAKHQNAIETDNQEAEVSLYVPYVPRTKSSSIRTYTYNGLQMREELIYYYDIQTNWQTIGSGSTASSVASTATSIVIGTVSASLGNVYSILDLFLNVNKGASITGSYNDTFQVNIHYDIYEKSTFVNDPNYGGWIFGSRFNKVYVTFMDVHQYYMTNLGGKSTTSIVYINKGGEASYYSDPARISYQYRGSGYTDLITGRIGRYTIYF